MSTNASPVNGSPRMDLAAAARQVPMSNKPPIPGAQKPAKAPVTPPAADTAPLTEEERLRAEIARLQADNERLKAARTAKQALTLRVSEKGALSVYGLGRFPFTLYKEQWERLLAAHVMIEDFILDHDAELKSKE